MDTWPLVVERVTIKPDRTATARVRCRSRVKGSCKGGLIVRPYPEAGDDRQQPTLYPFDEDSGKWWWVSVPHGKTAIVPLWVDDEGRWGARASAFRFKRVMSRRAYRRFRKLKRVYAEGPMCETGRAKCEDALAEPETFQNYTYVRTVRFPK